MTGDNTGHPDVPESIFDNEDRTVERRWQIFLKSVQPLELMNRLNAISEEDCKVPLGENGIMPESVTLNTVSFYFTGTYREAYIKAQEKCDKLESMESMRDSSWEFESGSIVATGK